MPLTAENQRALEAMFGFGVQEQHEQGLRLIVLPAITLPAGCKPAVAMGIYVASPYQGYDSRLYLESPITLASGAQPATSTAVFLNRTMYAASIQGIPAALPPHQAILAHLQRYAAAA